jgi:choline dehydrogenase-like flavoprotein
MNSNTEYDLIVIGSGIAGGIVASQVAKQNLKVLILEAGPRLDRGQLIETFRRSARRDSMAPYPKLSYAPQADPVGQPDYLTYKSHPYGTVYIRALGGTTWHWAGLSWRFVTKDFKLQSHYGVGRDWPIDYADLEPYYQQAELGLGVAGVSIKALDQPRSAPFPLPPVPFSYMDQQLHKGLSRAGFNYVPEPAARNTRPYDSRPPCCGSNSCMHICPTGAQYAGIVHINKAEAAGAELITNAVAYKLQDAVVNGQSTIVKVHYKTPDGKSYAVRGRKFVIACNAIETPKLMLMSKSTAYPNGVGNSSGLVGRNLMDHPGMGAGFTLTDPVYSGRGPITIGAIVNYLDGDFRSKLAAKKISFGNNQFAPSVAKKLIEQGLAGKELEQQVAYIANRKVGAFMMHEQLPNPNNRVTLSETKFDALGLPHPEIDWSIDDYEYQSALETKRLCEKIAKAIGAVEHHVGFKLGTAAHSMGTTIMGLDKTDSVVDQNCRCHDLDNLYIAGSAVFPSGSSVNPTLTIAALSCRLADHLVDKLAKRSFN